MIQIFIQVSSYDEEKYFFDRDSTLDCISPLLLASLIYNFCSQPFYLH